MLDKCEFENEAKKFIDLFRKLEYLIKQECVKFGIVIPDKSEIFDLINKLIEKNHPIKFYKKDLSLIRRIRNVCTHDGDKDYGFAVCPNPNLTNKLQNIIDEIEGPHPIAKSRIMIKWSNIYKREITDNVFDTVKTMSEKVYTFVPILENKKFVGVFSKNILLDIIKKEEGIELNKTTDFSKLRENLKIENHSMEKFEFIPKDTSIYDVQKLFNNYFLNNKVLGCVFVTENGKKEESILGMFTAWDVLGN